MVGTDVVVFCGVGIGGDVGSFLGFCVGLDVGSSVPVGIGAVVVGNLVAGASVFGCAVGLFCGSFVGKSVEGKAVNGASVGDWLAGTDCGCLVGTFVDVFCGILDGDNVTTAPGEAIGDFIGIEKEGKLGDGDPIGESEVSLVGRLVVAAGGLTIGDCITGSLIGD